MAWGLFFIKLLGNTKFSQIKMFAIEISKEYLNFKYFVQAQIV